MFHYCKYDVVQEDGFQYCKKCGKAIKPKIQTAPCSHIWEDKHTLETFGRVSEQMTGILYVQQCTKCGEIKETKVRAGHS